MSLSAENLAFAAQLASPPLRPQGIRESGRIPWPGNKVGDGVEIEFSDPFDIGNDLNQVALYVQRSDGSISPPIFQRELKQGSKDIYTLTRDGPPGELLALTEINFLDAGAITGNAPQSTLRFIPSALVKIEQNTLQQKKADENSLFPNLFPTQPTKKDDNFDMITIIVGIVVILVLIVSLFRETTKK